MPTQVKVPEWLKFALTVAGLLVTMTLYISAMKSDIRNEVTERKAADKVLDIRQQEYEKDINRIVNMLEQELDRHHSKAK